MRVITIKNWKEIGAVPKAFKDVKNILKKTYKAQDCIIDLEKGKFRAKRKLTKQLLDSAFSNEVFVIQYPVPVGKTLLSLANKNRTILLIHDILGLRNQDEKLLAKEIKILKHFPYIIVHNDKMKTFLIQKGIKSQHMYCLELFDYLYEEEEEKKEKKRELIPRMKEEVTLCYAGSLLPEKSQFLYQMTEDLLPFPIYLYGTGIDERQLNAKIRYEGNASPDELPHIMKGHLGLIWDGQWDEVDENKGFKNYTKYNTPHKLSCYLAAGIPVIVWEKSAIAEMVKRENIGYTIRTLEGIKNLNFQEYFVKKERIKIFQQNVRSGYYTKRVMEQIRKRMEEKNK